MQIPIYSFFRGKRQNTGKTRRYKHYLQNLIKCNIKVHELEQNNQEIQMLYLQQHTSTCDVTPRAGFTAFNLRNDKQVGVQPSSVISGETQDCPVSISLHPEVGGVNCPQVVPPSPLIVKMPRPLAGR